MEEPTEYCDLCWMNGEKRKAVAQYWDETGKCWAICRKCLRLVKQAGLKWEKLEATDES